MNNQDNINMNEPEPEPEPEPEVTNEPGQEVAHVTIQPQQNQGTGAGGANTNANGLPYELQLNLDTEYIIIEENDNYNVIEFNLIPDVRFITGSSNQFKRYLNDEQPEQYRGNSDLRLHGTRKPDSWFLQQNGNKLFILEIKSQRVTGSTAEKLQTAVCKLREFNRRYPLREVKYIYGLCPWFREECPGEIRDLVEDNIPHFWGDDPNYKSNIVNYMHNNL